jgi:hypothetical protein
VETAADLLSRMKDSLSPEDPPGPPPGVAWWPWLLGVGVAVLVAVAVWRLRRRRPRLTTLSARDAALVELDRIASLRLIEGGEIERFHVLAAESVRGFLESQYELPATRQTTPEFLDLLRGSEQLDAGMREGLTDFLRRCDLAKFAGVRPDAESCQATLALARQIIRTQVPVKPS